MSHFKQLISKEGETINHYVHSFETSRDSTTNLKESLWAAAVSITGIVRTQPKTSERTELGIKDLETIVILSETSMAEEDVMGWSSKYYDVMTVEEVFFRKARNYYKATCLQRVEFLGN